MDAKHTATPWSVCTFTPSLIEAVTTSITEHDDGKRIIAQAVEPIPHIGNAELNANAAFIVRACNAYGDLVTALETMLEIIDENGLCMDGSKDYEQACATLAKAEIQN